MRIDCHQHFWQYDAERDHWITSEMKVLQNDFMPSELESLLKDKDFGGCIAVQADQSEAENEFLLAQASGNSFIKGIVGWLDFQSADIRERLRYYRQFPEIRGFRHGLQGERQRDFMLRADFMRGIAELRDFGFIYEILILADQLQYVPAFAEAFPDQKFVIDHMAKPDIRSGALAQWKKEITAAAACKNVYCKVSGMVTEASWLDWKKSDFEPYMDVVVGNFGTERLMYGSDWPVCLLAASYQDQLAVVESYFAQFSRNEQDGFFGSNAEKFYGITD